MPMRDRARESSERRSGSGPGGARWPAGRPSWVADRLRALHPGLTVELVEIKTQGDRDRNSPLAAIGGLGLFTKEIQRALLEGAVEVAVHSLKDLPTQGPDGPDPGRRPAREDPADALIAPGHRTLDALPDGRDGRHRLAPATGPAAPPPARPERGRASGGTSRPG